MTPERLRRASDDPEGPLWLAELLWQLGGVQFGDFSLGRTVRHSPVYINPKLIIARPDALARIASIVEEELRMAMARRNSPVRPFDLIAGVPIGGLHIATPLSLRLRLPMLYTRPQAAGVEGAFSFMPDEQEPARAQIEGIYRPGQSVLVADDLAAGGGSLVQTISLLRRAGLTVHDAVVLIDREQGAVDRLEAIGVHLHPMLTLEALLNYLHGADHLGGEEYRRAMEYLYHEGIARSEFD